MYHTLYIVGTPIGNLEDITPRALGILKQVGLIAAEDPSKTQRLLSRYDIHTPMMRFTDAYDRKKRVRLQSIVDALQRADVALVSEAGMPLLADPGYELMQIILDNQIRVTPIPGPTAVMTALAVSGLPAAPFVFLGFPPRKSRARREMFDEHIQDPRTLVMYESPYRLLDTLLDAQATLGEREVAVCCELTKLYEEVWRGPLSKAISLLESRQLRGEFVIILDGANTEREER